MGVEEETPIQWNLSQCFGGDDTDTSTDPAQADVISACAFDTTGNYLAAGDNGGRIVVWEKDPQPRPRRNGVVPPMELRFCCEFQSHDPEFDCLRSVEIGERINAIRWLNRPCNGKFLLTTNDKTVKLWKIFDKSFTTLLDEDPDHFPRQEVIETAKVAKAKGIFTNAHGFHINSVSPCCDGETFLSSDDLRINIWNLNIMNTTMNVLDRKPDSMDELAEVITVACFHPTHAHEFVFATNQGIVNLCDLRAGARCDAPVGELRYTEPFTTVFTELVSAITDARFHPSNDRILMTRDYMTLKVWDLAMSREPIKVVRVHDHLRGKLDELYESDSIFDRFKCAFSHDGAYMLTGSYQNVFHIHSLLGSTHLCLDATSKKKRRKKLAAATAAPSGVDTTRKGLIVEWSPTMDLLALCTATNLFIYTGDRNHHHQDNHPQHQAHMQMCHDQQAPISSSSA